MKERILARVEEAPLLTSIPEAADVLCLTPFKLRSLIARGMIEVTPFGKQLRISRKSLRQHVQQHG
jgi:excisionase family DNA binding protein